jgi:hypothetical protein
MDIYNVASAYLDQTYVMNDPTDPSENPPFDPQPEVPVPNVPEETPPLERDPENPPVEPKPELPDIEPVVPEVEPLREPGEQPDIPAFN